MKIIVFDDDPTGSQTVHGCPLLLSWELDVLREGLCHPSPLMFVLTNTRSLLPSAASERNREICKAIKGVIAQEQIDQKDLIFISRGDSTLRGHGVLEPRIIESELGPFEATFHVPAFFEGGRTTIDGVHLLDGVPVHKTSYANDNLFGFQTSHLASWLEEKSGGDIKKDLVQRLSLNQLDLAISSASGLRSLEEWMSALHGNQHVVVDAEHPRHLEVFGKVVRSLLLKKRFLFRSAASLINGLAKLDAQTLGPKELVDFRRRNNFGIPLEGMVIVGSFVPLADIQLKRLLESSKCVGIEVQLATVLNAFWENKQEKMLLDLVEDLVSKIRLALSQFKTPVLYTSRGEINFLSAEKKVAFGKLIAELIARITAVVAPEIGYLISKGGITTNTLLRDGLHIKILQLDGQILPGLSLVRSLKSGPFCGLPILTFPGNLGDEGTLLEAWSLMETCRISK